jgi:hypothetical protein
MFPTAKVIYPQRSTAKNGWNKPYLLDFQKLHNRDAELHR